MPPKGFHEPDEKPRRFYKAVSVVEDAGRFGVALDERRVRMPKGPPLILPTRALAEQVAEEWHAQDPVIDIAAMHVTRLANTAREATPGAREETAAQVASYAGSDVLCYYSDAPAELTRRQEENWGPVLARAEAETGLAFVRCTGIIHREQPSETLAKVKALALALDDFTLAGVAFGVSLFGSAVLALGLQRGWFSGERAYELSRLDEAFQEEKWGVDEEAGERTARLYGEARMLDRWFRGLSAA